MNIDKVNQLNTYLKILTDIQDNERINRVCDAIEGEFGISPAPQITKKEDDCLIIGLLDVSGSMGVFEKEATQEYFELATDVISKKYRNITKKHITFHAEAKLLNDDVNPFGEKESGGTLVSSSIREAIKLISKHQDKNIYVFLMSDGDNLTSDNPRVNDLLIKEVLDKVNHFQYVEVNQYNRRSTLLESNQGFNNTAVASHEKFSSKILRRRNDALTGLRFSEYIKD